MDLLLKRSSAEADGIFGCLSSRDQSCILAQTLEHAFPVDGKPDEYAPVIPPGTYTCMRGQHQLAHMDHPFETFEIVGVDHHSKLLFHTGNVNADSEGCVLLGQSRQGVAILQSRIAFANFMRIQAGLQKFSLVVE